jgi:hypothetical protein
MPKILTEQDGSIAKTNAVAEENGYPREPAAAFAERPGSSEFGGGQGELFDEAWLAAWEVGGVEQFDQRLLDRHAGETIAVGIFNRVSTYKGAGKGKEKLAEKTLTVLADVLTVIGDRPHVRVRDIEKGVEKGQMSKPRPHLTRLIEDLRKWDGRKIVVARDLARFIRAEAFDENNLEARPTPEEFDLLREMSSGIILATLEDPAITEAERHRRATVRGGCGRPSDMSFGLCMDAFRLLGTASIVSRKAEWEMSLFEVAERLSEASGQRITKSHIQRLLDGRVPEEMLRTMGRSGRPGMRWKDFMRPGRAWAEAWQMGWVKRRAEHDE